MRTRVLLPSEFNLPAQLHADMEMPYQMPDVSSPLFAVRIGAFNNDRMRGCLLVKIIGEAFLLLDPAMGEAEKSRALVLLDHHGRMTAKAKGFDEASAWPPPEVEPWFTPALEHLGWCKSPWPNWSIAL